MRAHAPLVATVFALFFASGPARAQQAAAPSAAAPEQAEPGHRPFSGAALLGYGFSERPDSQNIGLGVRAGLTTPTGLYFGGTGVYHIGGLAEVDARDDGSRDVIVAKSFYLGGELGLALKVGPFTMRPYAGLGVHALLTTVKTINGQSTSTEVGPYIAPGLSALYPLFVNSFVGLDSRYIITPLHLKGRGVGVFATFGRHFLKRRASGRRVRLGAS